MASPEEKQITAQIVCAYIAAGKAIQTLGARIPEGDGFEPLWDRILKKVSATGPGNGPSAPG